MDTPRTDAAALGFARLLIDREKQTTTELVDANFARNLERENERLAAALEAIKSEFVAGDERKTYADPTIVLDRIREIARAALATRKAEA